MELKTAIEILDYHQEWRLGKRDDMIHEPKKLTQALDIVLSEVKKLNISVVSKRFWYFDCWDRKGNTSSRQIEALNAENAEIIFKYRYPDLGYDPPY